MRNPRQNSNRRLRRERHYLLSSAREMEETASLLTQSGKQKALDQAANGRNAARQILMLIKGAKLTEDRKYILWVESKPPITGSFQAFT